MKRMQSICWAASLALSLACQTQPPPQSPQPAPATAEARAPAPLPIYDGPPPRGIAPAAAFPAIAHAQLENGLSVRTLRHGKLPLVELRLVVLSGRATDGKLPGLAGVTGDLLKDGGAGQYTSRELVERADSLGSDLVINTELDKTVLSLSVTRHNLEPAVELLSTIARAPRFAAQEFRKLKERELERVKSAGRNDGGWMARMVLFRELFGGSAVLHPYAAYDAQVGTLERLKLEDCRRWYSAHFTPANALLVAAGDVEPSEVEALAKRHLGQWRGKQAQSTVALPPLRAEATEVWVVHRPKAAQSDVVVATLGPERKSELWPAAKVMDQILGGGVSGRLFLDVREQRSLAYSTFSQLVELASGPVPVLLSAGTQTAKTPLTVEALLAHYARVGSEPPSEAEVSAAAQYLADSFLMRLETLGSVADLAVHLAVLGLPDDALDSYRRDVLLQSPALVHSAARRYFVPGQALVVVAGDSERLAKPLTRFGRVHVVDPEQSFRTTVLLPHDPNVTLDVPDASP